MSLTLDARPDGSVLLLQNAQTVLQVSAQGAVTLNNRWSTANRPTGVPAGTTGFNTTNNKYEGFDGTRWEDLDGGKTWVRWAYPGTILASQNVASVVRFGVGGYRITFVRPFESANAYSTLVMNSFMGNFSTTEVGTQTANSVDISFMQHVSFSGDGRTPGDPNFGSIVCTGRLAQ